MLLKLIIPKLHRIEVDKYDDDVLFQAGLKTCLCQKIEFFTGSLAENIMIKAVYNAYHNFEEHTY